MNHARARGLRVKRNACHERVSFHASNLGTRDTRGARVKAGRKCRHDVTAFLFCFSYYSHGQMQRDREIMSQNPHLSRFLSMQAKIDYGLITVTRLKNVAFQIYQWRAIIGPPRTVCYGSSYPVRI